MSATAVLQAPLSIEVARSVKTVRPQAYFINCCFPDVVNPLIAALDLPITSGVGNIAILSNAFAGVLGDASRLKVLAHYRTLRRGGSHQKCARAAPPASGSIMRKSADVYARFAGVRLTREPAIEISGPSGVPLMLAMAAGKNWNGHMPGPNGLPGGYPVKFSAGRLDLDLPAKVAPHEAIAWNLSYERDERACRRIEWLRDLYRRTARAACGVEPHDR